MGNNKEEQKKFESIFNEKIKETQIKEIKSEKICKEIDSYIQKNKNLLDSKVLSIMREVPERNNRI